MIGRLTRPRVCFPFVGDTVGGSHVSALLHLRNLDPRQFRALVAVHQDGLLPSRLCEESIRYRTVPVQEYVNRPFDDPENDPRILRMARPLRRFLARNRISIVHTNDLRMHATWATATCTAKRRQIWHQRTARFGSNRMKRDIARQAARIVCISKYVRDRLPDDLEDRACVIHNPFATDQSPPDRDEAKRMVLEAIGCPVGTRVVGFYGNLTEQKRPVVFVDVAGRLTRGLNEPLAFVVAGADREFTAAELGRLAAEQGLSNQLHVVGFQSPVEPWMAGCDLIVAPAVEEGFGRTLIEAMLVGTPVVAASSGGHREIIEHDVNGRLAAADNPEALAASALDVLRDFDRTRALSDEAQRRVRRDYSVTSHVNKMMDLYNEVLAEPPVPPRKVPRPDDRS